MYMHLTDALDVSWPPRISGAENDVPAHITSAAASGSSISVLNVSRSVEVTGHWGSSMLSVRTVHGTRLE